MIDKNVFSIRQDIKKNKLIKRSFVIFIILALVFLLVCLIMTPKIDLKGGKEIVLEYPMNYKEPGYRAYSMLGDISNKTEVKGKVNDQKLGTYKITYVSKYFIFKTEVVRVVNIVDKEKPVITLKGNEETKVCPYSEYKEEGFEVSDNYDKDLKDKVSIKKNNDEIIYSVSDFSGNKTEVIRKIVKEDKEKPKIELIGSNKTYLFVGSTYNEQFAKASDNCDGDLTKNIKVSGKVNTSKIGTYYVTYTVKDKTGNEASVKREVVVQNKTTSSLGCGVAGAIYLTFDDGPNAGTTAQILDVLKKEGVKATFFVTNKGPDSLIKREYDEGHTIGLHTASHNYSEIYASVDSYFKDLNSVSNRVKRITGYESKFIRFPGGSSNTVSKKYQVGIMTTLTNEVVKKGYKYYDWNISSEDAGRCASVKTSACVYDSVTKQLSKNKCNMVLMHDIKSYTANAIRDIIRYGKNNGYVFMKIDENTPMVRQKVNN